MGGSVSAFEHLRVLQLLTFNEISVLREGGKRKKSNFPLMISEGSVFNSPQRFSFLPCGMLGCVH